MLKDWMIRNGWTRAKMAQSLGLTPTSVSRICAGSQRPTPEVAVKLEEITGVAAWEWIKPVEGPPSAPAQPAA